MRIVLWVFSVFSIMALSNAYAEGVYVSYSQIKNSNLTYTNRIDLNEEESRWVEHKKNFIIATSPFEISTLLSKDSSSRAQGILADYFHLMETSLKLKVIIHEYPTQEKAIAALENNQADMVLSSFTEMELENEKYLKSSPILSSSPALISSKKNTMLPSGSNHHVSVARAGNSPSDSFIKEHFPNANITSFKNNYQAISEVDNNEADYFFGNGLIIAAFMSKSFPNSLNLIKNYREPVAETHFISKSNQPLQARLIERFIASLSNDIRTQILKNWIGGDICFFTQKNCRFTMEELNWIKQNKKFPVLVNPYFPPFTLLDDNGTVRGIMGDILNIVHLQTGIDFDIMDVSSNKQLFKDAEIKNNSLILAATFNEFRNEHIAFSDTILTSPVVFVSKLDKKTLKIKDLERKMKVGMPSHYAQEAELRNRYPEVQWITVDNSSSSLQSVAEGKLDAVVTTELTARFMIEHYYSNVLYYSILPDISDASISFAFPQNNMAFKSILNKVLNNIPESEISRITEKWLQTPEIRISTWELYKKEIYFLVFISLSLFIIGLTGWIFLQKNIQRKIKHQQHLENLLKFRQTLTDSMPLPVYLVSPRGEILSYNESFRLFFTERSKRVVPHTLTDDQSPLHEVFLQLQHFILSNINEKMVTQEMVIRQGEETRQVSHWIAACQHLVAQDDFYICGWEDVTESKNLIAELEAERNKAIHATEAKSQFLAYMSHEIRTPVSSVIGFLELLTNRRLTKSESTEALALAYTSARSLLGLIGDVLDMDKIESGNYSVEPQWVDLFQLINETTRSFEAEAKIKNISLNLKHGFNGEIDLFIDPQAFRQIYSNILSNAVKFTDTGSVEIVSNIITESSDKFRLGISVSDTGCGVSDSEQEKLFKKYQRAVNGTKISGSGLGLVICKKLISMMSGNIIFESVKGQGTHVELSFPVAIRHTHFEPEVEDEEGKNPHLLINILIADDHPTNRILLERQLDEQNYHVETAVDGKDALRKVKRRHYDLLITDLHMPGLSGLELTREIRKFNSSMAIWGLTASVQANDTQSCLEAGMNKCLFKPINRRLLQKSIEELSFSLSPRVPNEYFDISIIFENAQKDPNLVNKILITFQSETLKDIAAAKSAVETHDLHALRQATHKIYGAAQLLNIKPIIDAALFFESMAVYNSKTDVVISQFDTLERVVMKVINEISTHSS